MSYDITLINNTDAETTSQEFNLDNKTLPANLKCIGLGSGETVDLQQSVSGSSTWEDVKDINGQVQLTEDINNLAIYCNQKRLRVYKAATAGAVTVELTYSE